MDNIFLLLFLTSALCLSIGLVNPVWVSKLFRKGKVTRKRIVTTFVSAAIVFFALFGLTTEPTNTNKSPINTSPTSDVQIVVKTPAPLDSYTPTVLSSADIEKLENDQIARRVSEVLKGQNNLQKSYLRDVRIVKQENGGWGAFIEFNSSDNLSTNLRKSGIEMKMSEIYIALYTSSYDIKTASVAAYFPLVDAYGNEKDGLIYKSMLDKSEASKVNWKADSSTLKLDILPRVWSTSFLHSEFR